MIRGSGYSHIATPSDDRMDWRVGVDKTREVNFKNIYE